MEDLAGDHLNYWVARAEGLSPEMLESGPVLYVPGEGQQPIPAYCSDWTHGEAIMDRLGMHLAPLPANAPFGGIQRPTKGWVARPSAHPVATWGRTMLEAGMRAYLAAEMGEYILA